MSQDTENTQSQNSQQDEAADQGIRIRDYVLTIFIIFILLIPVTIILYLGGQQFFRINEQLDKAEAILVSIVEDENNATQDESSSNVESNEQTITMRELRILAEQIERAENRALDYLSLYEALGFALTVGGAIIALIGSSAVALGLRNYQEIVNELNDTRKEMTESEQAAKTILEDIEKERQSVKKDWGKSHLALSLVHVAERQYRYGNADGALRTFKRAIELDKTNAVPYYYQGYILTQQEHFEDAIDSLNTALQHDNQFYHAEAALGYALRRQADHIQGDDQRKTRMYQLAEDHLRKALRQDKQLIDAYGESWYGALASLYKKRKDFNQAIRYYERAQQVTKLSSYPAINLALIALERGDNNVNQRFEDVERLATRKIDADILYYWAYGDLLMAQLILNKQSQVQETMTRLFDVIPPSIEDVLSRIVKSLNEVRNAGAYPEDKRDIEFIDRIIKELEDHDDST